MIEQIITLIDAGVAVKAPLCRRTETQGSIGGTFIERTPDAPCGRPATVLRRPCFRAAFFLPVCAADR